MRTGRPPASPSRGDPFFLTKLFQGVTSAPCINFLSFGRGKRRNGQNSFFVGKICYSLVSNTQELCRFDRSGVLNGGPKGRQNTKTRNFLRKKLQNLGFRFGGQTAPSELAPRVGGTGDVLAGLLPSHSNIFGWGSVKLFGTFVFSGAP